MPASVNNAPALPLPVNVPAVHRSAQFLPKEADLPPRPVGIHPQIPWEPRAEVDDPGSRDFISWIVEWLEENPQWPNIGASILRVLARIRGTDQAEAVRDISDQPGAWKFSAIGDFGAGTAQQARVAANILAGKPEFLLTTGDNAYPTGRWEDYENNIDPEHLMGGILKTMPVMPSIGNHDSYRDSLVPYFAHFPHLNGHPYYTFKHKDVTFIALDSNQELSPGSFQYRWLEKALQEADTPWKVVYFHHPIYTSNYSDLGDSELQRVLQPLLARYGVQLVVGGHVHAYERTHAIDGVTHITTGGGGQIVYPFRTKKPEFIANRVAAYHHVEVSVTPTTMTIRALDDDGKLIDVHRIPVTGANDARMSASQVRPAS